MVVAITPRQWTGLVKVLGLEAEVAALEHERGVSFAKDEGIRFKHSDVLMPLIERAVKQRRSTDLGEALEANAVCWSQYRTLKAALAEDAYFGARNPVLSTLEHVSGRRYPAAGFVGTSPTEVRKPPTPAHRLGEDTDEVLAEVLRLDDGEIARLHDAGLVASA